MCILLRLPYLALTGMVAFLKLLPNSSTDKDIEILVLRHQPAILQRHVPKPRLTPPDRAFLAALLHRLPRPTLRTFNLIVSDTILHWHRNLLHKRHGRASRPKRPGRPPTIRSIQTLVLRLARENPNWGYRRIHGELAALAIKIAPPPSGRSSEPTTSNRHLVATDRTGPPSCAAEHTPSSLPTFFEARTLTGTRLFVLAVIEEIRTLAIWSLWLILATNLIDVRWWPLGTAVGYTGVLLSNVLSER